MKQFIIRKDDERAREAAIGNLSLYLRNSVTQNNKDYEVRVVEFKQSKTPQQNNTLWMWHTEIASQLTIRCREAGHNIEWSRTDVHDLIFKPRFMPHKERVLPDGELITKPMNTSDKDCDLKIVSEAMERYLSWIYGEGMEVTIPDDPQVQQISRRAQ